jgi:hypothetical protein
MYCLTWKKILSRRTTLKDQHPEVIQALRADLIRRFEEVGAADNVIE